MARREASPFLSCPTESLTVVAIGPGRYAVEGCGHGVFVVCETSKKHGTVCVVDDVPQVASLTPPPPAPDAPHEFDPDEARVALEHVLYGECGAIGPSRLEITFATDGTVAEARIAEGALSESAERCVIGRFFTAKIPPFYGEKRRVLWSIAGEPAKNEWPAGATAL